MSGLCCSSRNAKRFVLMLIVGVGIAVSANADVKVNDPPDPIFAKGDEIVVVAAQAKLKVNFDFVGEIPETTRLTVRAVDQDWLWVQAEINGKETSGWIDKGAVELSIDGLKQRGVQMESDPEGNVVFLDLTNAKADDRLLTHLYRLRKLRDVLVGGDKITDAGLAELRHLKHIEVLVLANTSLTDAAIPHLSKLITLQLLDLSGTGLTSAGVTKLESLLPGCSIQAPEPSLTAGT